MKLPEDKAERNKMLGLIGVGVIALAYVTFAFGISPFFQKQNAAEIRISELDDRLWKSKKDIQNAPLNSQKNNELLTQILEASEKEQHILRPSLGNYLLVATDIISRHADAVGITIESISETRPTNSQLPEGHDPNGPRFKAYTVNVKLTCNVLELMKLIEALETANPYLCITRMGIFGRATDIEQHAVSFDVQWPAWIDNDLPLQLAAEQLSDEERE
jgi:hypothetical protein